MINQRIGSFIAALRKEQNRHSPVHGDSGAGVHSRHHDMLCCRHAGARQERDDDEPCFRAECQCA